MALNKATLQSSILATLNTLKTYDGSSGKTQTDAINKFATDLSNAIDIYVKSGTVTTAVTTVAPFPTTGTGIGSVT